jgi:hypothetical protein
MKNANTKSRILSIIALVAIVVSIVGCSTPRCGYMKHYNRDVRMGIAR